MNIALAGLGWIDDATPEGNRLRWSYPFAALAQTGEYLGLPDNFIVERAELGEDLWTPPAVNSPDGAQVSGSWLPYPLAWWSAPTNIQLSDWFTVFRLQQPVQALRFTYHGPATRVRIWDRASRRKLADLPIKDQEYFCYAAGRIDEVSFLPLSSTLVMEGFSSLDLFQDRQLHWQQLTVIQCNDTLREGVGLEDVMPRYGLRPSIGARQWEELTDLGRKARDSHPPARPPAPVNMRVSKPNAGEETLDAWKTFEMMLGLRWEFACLLGFGCYDGPRRGASSLDQVNARLALRRQPTRPVAYRVRSSDARVECGNIVVCPAAAAGALAAPSVPRYLQPEVRLGEKEVLEASLLMDWIQHDFNATAAEIQEEMSASPAKGGSASERHFEYRSVDPEDPPFTGRLRRRFDVPWHDVTLQARAHARDAWDRTSDWSPWSAPTSLELVHSPYPPPLVSAKYVNGTVTITLQPGATDVPAWAPDAIVAGPPPGKVFFYRRDPNKPLSVAAVQVGAPFPSGAGDVYAASITPKDSIAFNPQDFQRGTLVVGKVPLRLVAITSTQVHFELSTDAASYASAFAANDGTLYQDERNESLWTKVHEESSIALGPTVQFNEPLPFPTLESDVLQYAARISYMGRLGPFGNVVSDFRIPVAPPVPPPFTVTLEGVDFYERTLSRIKLTQSIAADAMCRVCWALGDYTGKADDFSQRAVAGLYGPQTAQGGSLLHEVLSLPLDQATGLPLSVVTIGVQRVNASGGQSRFALATIKP